MTVQYIILEYAYLVVSKKVVEYHNGRFEQCGIVDIKHYRVRNERAPIQ